MFADAVTLATIEAEGKSAEGFVAGSGVFFPFLGVTAEAVAASR